MCDRPVDGTSDATASSGFMCPIRMTFPRAYPDRRPGRRPGLPARPDQSLARRELRSKRMGAEKSGVGAVSIRRREAVGLGHGDIRTKPISIIGIERQQTVQSHVSGVLALPTIAGLYRIRAGSNRFAIDSPLEQEGFELVVP